MTAPFPDRDEQAPAGSLGARAFPTTKAHGTGMSLSTSLAIARPYGGDLTFASTPGKGTTFTLTQPIQPGPILPLQETS